MSELNLLKDAIFSLALQYGWTEFECNHAIAAAGHEYGDENILVIANGRELRTPAHPAECTYARVVQAGHEIGYWVSDEWRDDPELAMGALLGAANGPGLGQQHVR